MLVISKTCFWIIIGLLVTVYQENKAHREIEAAYLNLWATSEKSMEVDTRVNEHGSMYGKFIKDISKIK